MILQISLPGQLIWQEEQDGKVVASAYLIIRLDFRHGVNSRTVPYPLQKSMSCAASREKLALDIMVSEHVIEHKIEEVR